MLGEIGPLWLSTVASDEQPGRREGAQRRGKRPAAFPFEDARATHDRPWQLTGRVSCQPRARLRRHRHRPRPPRHRRGDQLAPCSKLDGNIEDSQMSILRGHFAVMLIVRLGERLVDRRPRSRARRGPRPPRARGAHVRAGRRARALPADRDPRRQRLRGRSPRDRRGDERGARRPRGSTSSTSRRGSPASAESPIYAMLMEVAARRRPGRARAGRARRGRSGRRGRDQPARARPRGALTGALADGRP